MSHVLSYLYFSDQVDLIRLRNQLSQKECELLRIIAKSHLSNGTTRATQLLEMEFMGSPSTIHSSIKRLISKKMLLVSADNVDNRIKYLFPSPKALSLLNELGELIRSSLVNNSSSTPSENTANAYSIVEIETLSMNNAG